MKITFFGTSAFAIPALKALHGAGFDLTVVTMPDQPMGRKKVITAPPIKITAQELGLTVLQPESLKKDVEFFDQFVAINADLAVVASYGNIIPQQYLDSIPKGFLNIHPSLLPKYRGPTPIQTAILNGDPTSGVTIIQLDAGMDSGPIVSVQEIKMIGHEYYQEAHDKLAELGANLLIETIPKYMSGEISPQKQKEKNIIITKKYIREDGRLDWDKPQIEIYNKIRALNPEPGAWTMWQDKILNIKKADLVDNKLKLDTIQLESKKETSLSEFLHGHPDFDISQLK